MTDFLETRVDKFILRVKKGDWYHPEGLWLHVEGGQAVIGVTDYLQLKAGDIHFVGLPEVGQRLARDRSLGAIESMKVTIDLPSPASGLVVASNPELGERPELVNEDPYGEGWLVRIQLAEGEDPTAGLVSDEAYFGTVVEDARTQA